MKIIALNNIEMPGYGIVKRGTVIDYAKDAIDERIAANFRNASDDSILKVAKKMEDDRQQELFQKGKAELLAEQEAKRKEDVKALIEKLTVEGIKEQLAELQIPFKADMSDEKLAGLLLDRIGD